jgi:hypothetical protein
MNRFGTSLCGGALVKLWWNRKDTNSGGVADDQTGQLAGYQNTD